MKVFITGSSDGLGQLAAMELVKQGYQVVLHARNSERGKQALSKVPQAEKVLIADLTSIEETKKLASEVNAIGEFDAVIHNAGVNNGSRKQILNVNCLAPYILTSLIKRPKRIIYIGSGMHRGGSINFKSLSSGISYSDSKLYLLMLSKAVARNWNVYSNIVNPGWVPTKMGGSSAPDDLQKGVDTQVWLAVSNDEKAKVNGRYFFHQQETQYNTKADDISLQDQFLKVCEELTGVQFPN